MTESSARSLVEEARDVLSELWNAPATPAPSVGDEIPLEIVEAITRSINSTTKSYRYVLPTQVLAKSANVALDCRAIQATCGLVDAFDARSLCDAVIVPFDRVNHNVLGGSTEPYANNPLRIPALLSSHRNAQRNKRGYDDLTTVLEWVQSHPTATRNALKHVLETIRGRLKLAAVVYPVPNRVSLHQAELLIEEYLTDRTGGIRMQAIAVALFRAIGHRLSLFDDVVSADINASDASTGSAADLECRDSGNVVVLAVEVKDRRLTLRHAQDKLPGVREKGIRELIFLVRGGIESVDQSPTDDLISKQFAAGQNVYVVEFAEFLRTCLVLVGEPGRRAFLVNVGTELDARRVDLIHRQVWARLLDSV